MSTVAHDILWPKDTTALVRACFLYVGQGSSILLLVRDGQTYRALLLDSNFDRKNGGIDVAKMTKDVLPDGKLYAFVNTHPHDDHLKGLKEVSEAVTIERVWHTGFEPGSEEGNHYCELEDVIKQVKKRSGDDAVLEIRGSNSATSLLDAQYYVFAPADHVKEDINDEEDAEARYRRIHEHCGVLKFGKGDSWVLVTGDADLEAFKSHITPYHGDSLKADILDASHHGSRSFFMTSEGDDPYLDGLKAIDPKHVVISAPTVEESRHDHPHPDAVKLYVDHVGSADRVLHTGAERETFYFDILDGGGVTGPFTDDGKLAEKYGFDANDDAERGDSGGGKNMGPFIRPSAPTSPTPKKYGQGPKFG